MALLATGRGEPEATSLRVKRDSRRRIPDAVFARGQMLGCRGLSLAGGVGTGSEDNRTSCQPTRGPGQSVGLVLFFSN